jgi:hypothetical protein
MPKFMGLQDVSGMILSLASNSPTPKRHSGRFWFSCDKVPVKIGKPLLYPAEIPPLIIE